MKELAEIVRHYENQTALGKDCVLATVVRVEGSSYRRPGAKMLVLPDGSLTGAISGGCLEGDALKKAMLTLSERTSRIVTYDTRDEEDTGIQLGCEGVIDVLFEYIDVRDPQNPVELIKRAIAKRQKSVLVTLFDLIDKKSKRAGTRYLLEQSGEIVCGEQATEYLPLIEKDVENGLSTGLSSYKTYDFKGECLSAFIQYIDPPVSLVIVGAGNDAIPLVDMAQMLGWEVTLADGRKTPTRMEKFAQSCQVLVSNPETLVHQLRMDHKTCVVLLTHNYQYDKQMLRLLLQTDVPYIGMLGPRKKLEKILHDFQNEGMVVSDEMLSRVYGPTGLDIGAETPEEIALSIASEIQAVFTQKQGTMLKWKRDIIHS
jgi:xanthine/CO dehydrogenase XdhC/CoxF family maturation factor